MHQKFELCTFEFEDIDQAPNGKPVIRLNFSKTDKYGTDKLLPIKPRASRINPYIGGLSWS